MATVIDTGMLEARYKSKSDLTENGFKGLVLINGGAAVALGALLQAVITQQDVGLGFIRCVLIGIAFNIVGVATAAGAFIVRYRQLRLEAETSKFMSQNVWWRWVWRLALLSIGCFMVGLGVVVWGGFTQLKIMQ